MRWLLCLLLLFLCVSIGSSQPWSWTMELRTDVGSWESGGTPGIVDILPGESTTIYYRVTNRGPETLTSPWAYCTETPGWIPTWAYKNFFDYTGIMAESMNGLAPGMAVEGIACEFVWNDFIGPIDFDNQWTIYSGIGNNNPYMAAYRKQDWDISYLGLDFAYDVTGHEFKFTASQSNMNLGYRWDFEGDGFWDTDWSYDRKVEHLYNEGVYSPILEAAIMYYEGEPTQRRFIAQKEIATSPEPVSVVLVGTSMLILILRRNSYGKQRI